MPNYSHIMLNPRVVPILWGHDYVANPATAKAIERAGRSDGEWRAGLAQRRLHQPGTAAHLLLGDREDQ